MDTLDQKLFINDFEEHSLYNFLKKYIIIPQVTLNKEAKEVSTFGEFTKQLKQYLNNLGKTRSQKIKAVETIYDFLCVNKKFLSTQPKLTETVKNKLVEIYFTDESDVYIKYYLEKIVKMYYKAIFGNNFYNFVRDTYFSDKPLGTTKASDIGRYIFSEKSKRQTKYEKYEKTKRDAFLTYTQARDLHTKIVSEMKEKMTKKNKDDFIKDIMSDINKFTENNFTNISHSDLDVFEKKMNDFEKLYSSEYKKFCDSDMSIEIKLKLYGNIYDTEKVLAERLYKILYKTEFLEYDITLFKYFLANRQKFNESICKNVTQFIYDYCIGKAKKEYKSDEKMDTITHIKLQIYINYHYGNMDDNSRTMYKEYCEAVFDKPFEFNSQMATLYAVYKSSDVKNAMSNNYDLVSNNEQFKNLIIETLLN